jgi:hypothetical protein
VPAGTGGYVDDVGGIVTCGTPLTNKDYGDPNFYASLSEMRMAATQFCDQMWNDKIFFNPPGRTGSTYEHLSTDKNFPTYAAGSLRDKTGYPGNVPWPVLVSATWVNGQNCPKLDFVDKNNNPGKETGWKTCKDRLHVAIDYCKSFYIAF